LYITRASPASPDIDALLLKIPMASELTEKRQQKFLGNALTSINLDPNNMNQFIMRYLPEVITELVTVA
jgi:hypothetical protein